MLKGNLDIADRNGIYGWVQDQSHPDEPVSLTITDNEGLIGCVLANRYRADLETAGIGNGRHAFNFTYPSTFSPFERHVVRVRCEIDGRDVAGSPVILEPLQAFDTEAQEALDRILARYGSNDDVARKIDFLARHIEELLQQKADHDSLRLRRAKFRHYLQRWKQRIPETGALAARAPPDPCWRALVIDDRIPIADRDAGSNAILSHIGSLQRLGYEVTFAPAAEFISTSATAAPEIIGVTCARLPFYGSVEELLWRQAGEFDLIYLHRISNAEKYGGLARQHFPKARLVYSVADLHHLRLLRQAKVEDRPGLAALAARTSLVELVAAATADAVITHSPQEAHVLKSRLPKANVHVVRWSMTPQPTKIPFRDRHDIAFIGSYGHAPNQDAARWLIGQIMPLVRQRDPAIRCLLVGSEMPDDLRGLCDDHVLAVGHVAHLAEVFDKVRLTVAPLAFGAGIKGKVLESLAAGVPCIGTPIAAEGLQLPDSLKSCIVDGTQSLANAICDFHENEAANEDCSRAGLDYITAELSAERLDALMRQVIGPRHLPPVLTPDPAGVG
jgi:glycosyltransferase involved in cell wall biosynthesis